MNALVRLGGILLGLLSAGLAGAGTIGMVLDLSGSSQAFVANQRKALDIAVSLDAGTRVNLSKGSEMSFVFYPTHQQFTIKGPAELQLMENSVKSAHNAMMVVKPLPENRSAAVLGFQDRVVPAALVMRKFLVKPNPLAPQEGETVLTQRPEFAWTLADDQLDFSLTLDGAVLLQQSVTGDRLELPPNLILASGSEYRWQISYPGSDKTSTKWSTFNVASEALREKMQHSHPAVDSSLSDWVLYAMELEQAHMKSQANLVWKQVAEQRPGSNNLKDLARK
jgi:hypothetical protein